MKLVSSGARRFVLLAPARCDIPASFRGVQPDSNQYWDLLSEMQKLRGKTYLEDGAIQPSQLEDGRHCVSTDQESWHLLVLDEDQQVRGCVRYHERSRDIDPRELTVWNSALGRSMQWERPLEFALSAELRLARRLGYLFAEIGGWALAPEIRGTTEALRMTLGIFAFSEQLGGAVGLSTVTQRHCSASILKRIGGRPLEFNGSPLPPYYDPLYDCQMEVMRFYSWDPNPRYRVWVDDITAELGSSCVFTPHSGQSSPHRAYAASLGRR
jgi:hypothetical protein